MLIGGEYEFGIFSRIILVFKGGRAKIDVVCIDPEIFAAGKQPHSHRQDDLVDNVIHRAPFEAVGIDRTRVRIIVYYLVLLCRVLISRDLSGPPLREVIGRVLDPARDLEADPIYAEVIRSLIHQGVLVIVPLRRAVLPRLSSGLPTAHRLIGGRAARVMVFAGGGAADDRSIGKASAIANKAKSVNVAMLLKLKRL